MTTTTTTTPLGVKPAARKAYYHSGQSHDSVLVLICSICWCTLVPIGLQGQKSVTFFVFASILPAALLYSYFTKCSGPFSSAGDHATVHNVPKNTKTNGIAGENKREETIFSSSDSRSPTQNPLESDTAKYIDIAPEFRVSLAEVKSYQQGKKKWEDGPIISLQTNVKDGSIKYLAGSKPKGFRLVSDWNFSTCSFWVVDYKDGEKSENMHVFGLLTRDGTLLGQSFTHKLIASAKKLHAWEEIQFRTLDPGNADNSIGIFLHATRFGKGLWVSMPARSSRLQLAKESSNAIRFSYQAIHPVRQVPMAIYVSEIESINSKDGTQDDTSSNAENSVSPPIFPWVLGKNFFESDESDFHDVHETTLGISLDYFFETMLAEPQFFQDWHDEVGNKNMEITPWTYHPTVDANVRQHSFLMHLGKVPGLTESRVREYQTYKFNEEKTTLVYKNKTYSLDVPYGSYFSIETVYTLHKVDAESIQLDFKCAIHFNKSTLFRRQITKGSLIGTRISCEKMLGVLKDKVMSPTSRLKATLEASHEMSCDVYESIGNAALDRDIPDSHSSPTIELPWKGSRFFEIPEKQFKLVYSTKLECIPLDYFNHFLSDHCAFFGGFQKGKKVYRMEDSPWIPSEKYGHLRKASIPGLLDEYQCYVWKNKHSVLQHSAKAIVHSPTSTWYSIELLSTVTEVIGDQGKASSLIECRYSVCFSERQDVEAMQQVFQLTNSTMKATCDEMFVMASKHLNIAKGDSTTERWCPFRHVCSRVAVEINRKVKK